MLTTTSIFVWASLLNFSLGIPNPSPFGPFLDNALNNMMNNRDADYGKHCSLSFISYLFNCTTAAASMNPVKNKMINRGAEIGKYSSLLFLTMALWD